MAHRPFVLAVVGDLGGRREPGKKRLRRIDRDGFGALMERLAVSVEVPDGRGLVRLDLGALDDFRPDTLLRRIPGLAARMALGPAAPEAAPPPPAPRAPVPLPVPTGGPGVLDTILRESEGVPPLDPTLEDFVRRAAEPSLVRTSREAEARGREGRDAQLADGLRAVLHAPRFQALEAVWRGLHGLVTGAETGPGLEIRVLDAPPDEAAATLGEELRTPGGPAVTAIVAARVFGPDETDIATLAALAEVARDAGVPVVADASPALLGLTDARDLARADVRARIGTGPGLEAWRRFHGGPLARHVALCLPRVLLRLPYGPAGEEVSAFPFDEGLGLAEHERFLWGSSALAFGVVLARGFAVDGWGMDVAAHADLDGLPLYVCREAGEDRVLPCAEVVMSDATIRSVVEQGLIVLASERDADRAAFWGIGMVDGAPFPALG
jgi:type VI secretion system protein ImpC